MIQLLAMAADLTKSCNDHDPLPLLDQLVTRYGESVTIRYFQRDPGAIVIDFVKN